VSVGATGSAGRRVGHGPAESGVENGRPRRAVVIAVGTSDATRDAEAAVPGDATQAATPAISNADIRREKRDAGKTDPHRDRPTQEGATQEGAHTGNTQTTDTGRGTQRSPHTHSQTRPHSKTVAGRKDCVEAKKTSWRRTNNRTRSVSF